jgi:CRISPR-associated protein Csm5
LQAHYAELSHLSALQHSVQQLQNELASARNQPLTCVLSMGAGAGFLSKSAFLDTGQEAYRNILRSLPAIGKALREGVPFPKTRRIVFVGGQPSTIPGWVRVQFG